MSTTRTAGETGANGVKRVPPLQVFLSLSVLACWILLYAAGLLMESVEERIVLAPHTMEKQASALKYWETHKPKKTPKSDKTSATDKPLPDQKTSTEPSLPKTDASVGGNAAPNTAVTPNAAATSNAAALSTSDNNHKIEITVRVEGLPKAEGASKVESSPATDMTPTGAKVVEKILAEERSLPRSFFVALLIHTPTNMALLTLFAGCLGGCVSNIKYSMMTQEERDKLTTHESSILCENPLSATLRGFVIYLCLIAGLYAAVDDPFKDSTPGQYARLAGTLSLVDFIVGFDPSRIKTWLKMADPKDKPPTP